MSVGSSHRNVGAKRNKSRRSRKKRTTEIDSSSSSSSSSDSDLGKESSNEQEPDRNELEDINISEAELSEEEVVEKEDSKQTREEPIEEVIVSKEKANIHSQDSEKLKNEYLSLIFQNYGDEINQLREAPDFTTKSIPLLANVLKDGAAMFDEDTLRSILS